MTTTESLSSQYHTASLAFHTATSLSEQFAAQDAQNAIIAAAEAADDDDLLTNYVNIDEAARLASI